MSNCVGVEHQPVKGPPSQGFSPHFPYDTLNPYQLKIESFVPECPGWTFMTWPRKKSHLAPEVPIGDNPYLANG